MRIRSLTASALAASVGAAIVLLPPASLSSHTPITTTIVFQKEIARIFQRKCFQCHTERNLSMALTTYAEARPWAVAIKEEVLERRMPPWSAVSGYGHFANDASLTAREVSLILAWADGGAPSGVLKVDESKPPVFVPPLRGWEQGAPDVVLRVAGGEEVAAQSPDATARFTVDSGLPTSRWLTALQVNPLDRRVVRYAAVYDAPTGRWLGTWTPTAPVSRQPKGVAVALPARARLTVELGYRGTDEVAPGEAEIGLYFSAQRPANAASTIDMSTGEVTVAPAHADQRVRAEWIVAAPTRATALWPQLGVGARSAELTAIHPDGEVEPLLWLESYRPEWPAGYVLRDPVALPAGTRLVFTTYYDNTGSAPIVARPRMTISTITPSRPASAP